MEKRRFVEDTFILRMKFPLAWIVSLLTMISSCSFPIGDDLKCKEYKVVERLTEYPDSSFFSAITHMECHDDILFLLDKKRGDVVSINEEFSTFKVEAVRSEKDLLMPTSFSVWKDTMYLCDEASINPLKMYVGGSMIDNFPLEKCNEKHLAVTKDFVYLSFPTDTSCYVKIHRNKIGDWNYKGEVIAGNDGKKISILNEKHLFCNEKFLYAVSENFPYIDKYDLESDTLVERLDLSEVPIIKENLKFIERNSTEAHSYYVYIEDACLYSDTLYLLCATLGNEYSCNTLLEIDLSDEQMRPVSYCKLPDRNYTSIAFSGRFLYAACNGLNCAIEKIEF